MLDKKKLVTIAISLGTVLVLALGIWFFSGQNGVSSPSDRQSGGAEQPPQPSGSVTHKEVPKDVTVPGVNSADTPENVAKPTSVSTAAPNSSASNRSFNISISGNKFIPDTIIVKLGDTFNINVTAVDKDYYFSQQDFGWNGLVKKGLTQKFASGATVSGKFTFYCSSCGGPEKGPVGYLIIVD